MFDLIRIFANYVPNNKPNTTMQIDITKMNPAFVALVAAISNRDQVPFDKALITAGDMLAKLTQVQPAA